MSLVLYCYVASRKKKNCYDVCCLLQNNNTLFVDLYQHKICLETLFIDILSIIKYV